MNGRNSLINRLSSSESNLLKLILLIKPQIPQSEILTNIILFFRLFSYLIISSNFNCDYPIQVNSLFTVTKVLKRFTAFNFYLSECFSHNLYYLLCLIFYLLEFRFIINLFFLIHALKKKKKALTFKKENSISLSFLDKGYIYIHLFLSQYINEFLSMIFLFVTHRKNALGIIIAIFNVFFMFYNLFFSYTSFLIFNSPFIVSKKPIKIRHITFSSVLLIGEILLPFHFVENVIKNETVMTSYKVIMATIIFLIFINIFILGIKKYEFDSSAQKLIVFIVALSSISMFIEIFIYLSNYQFKESQLWSIAVLKIILSIIFIRTYQSYKQKKFVHSACNYLFLSYEEKDIFSRNNNRHHLESLYYLLYLIYQCKEHHFENISDVSNTIVDIIIHHISECKSKTCRCKFFSVLPSKQKVNKDLFYKKIIKSISLLIQTSFIKINFISRKNIKIAIFLSEFYYHVKNNLYLSYNVLISNVKYNHKKLRYYELVKIYTIIDSLINTIEENVQKKEKRFSKFIKKLDTVYSFKQFNNYIISLCTNYIDIINIKENIESSIRIVHDEDTSEVIKISSKNLSKQNITKIVEILSQQRKLYKKIKRYAYDIEFTQGNILYYFVVFIFFRIFRTRMPKKLLEKYSKMKIDNEYSPLNSTEKDSLEQFERLLNKYFMKNNNYAYQIILKCKKNNFIIKSITSQLVSFLNYTNDKLLDEPFDNLFPPFFKETHKKCMINYLSKSKHTFSISKDTYIFDYNFNAIPCNISAVLLPHLSHNLFIIIDIEVKYQPNSFSLFLNNECEVMAISRSVNKNLFFTLEMIKKYEINLLEIFDIHPFTIKQNFKAFEKKANLYVNNLRNNPNEIMIQNCFYIKKNKEEDKSYSLLEGKTNQNLVTEWVTALKKKNNIPPQEITNYTKSSYIILTNLICTLNKLSDLELKNDLYNNFNEIYIKLQNKLSEMDLLQNENQNMEPVYPIQITAKMCYTYLLYIVETKFKYIMNSTVYSLNNKKTTSNKNLLRLTIMKKRNTMNNNSIFKNSIRISASKKAKAQSNQLNIPYIEKETLQSKHLKYVKLRNYLSGLLPKSIFYITLVMLIILTGFSFSIFINLLSSFNSLNLLTNTFFMNCLQKDKLTEMISSFYTITFHTVPITVSSYAFELYFYHALELSYTFQYIFREFYSSYVDYNMKMDLSFEEITKEYTFIKMLNDWKNVTYQSDFISEMGMIYYNAYYSLLEFMVMEHEEIREDVRLIFNSSYLYVIENEEHEDCQHSKFAKFLFYITHNSYTLEHGVIQSIEDKLKDNFVTYKGEFRRTANTLEFVVFSIYVVLIIWLLVRLYKANIALFASVISIFSFKEQIEKSNKNSIQKQTCALFINLLQNFNENNFIELRKKKNEKIAQLINPNNSTLVKTAIASQTNSTSLNSSNSVHMLKNSSFSNSQISSKPSLTNSINSYIQMRKTTNHQLKIKKEINIIYKNIPSLFEVKKLNLIIYFQVITVILFLIYIMFTILRIIYTDKYLDNMSLSNNIYKLITQKYSIIFQVFTMIRLLIINNDLPSLSNLSLSKWIDIVNKADETLEEKVKFFPNTNNIRYLFQQKIENVSQEKIVEMCGNDTACITELGTENGYCRGGISLCIQTILQKCAELITDLTIANTTNIDYMHVYAVENKINKLEETLEFVMGRIKTYLYDSFFYDSTHLKSISQKDLDIINIVSFIFQLVSSFGVVLIFQIVLSKLHKQVVFSSYEMNCFMANKG